MLKQRLITASVLIPFLICGIFLFPNHYFAIMLALFVVLAGWEWAGFMNQSTVRMRATFAIIVAASLAAIWAYISLESSAWLIIPSISIIWWLFAIVLVLSYPNLISYWSSFGAHFSLGLLMLTSTWLSVVGLQHYGDQGPYLVFYLLTLISIADTGAYFGGKQWGKHKLAPEVSPGKTWEGVFSALFVSAVFAGIGAAYFSFTGNQWLTFIVLSLVTVVFSILGDLNESMFKRHAGLKDSGRILPGHGGIMDRMDGLTAAAPVFVVGLWLGGFNFTGLELGGVNNL
jgi:phosphatidate cytidylyltransferase